MMDLLLRMNNRLLFMQIKRQGKSCENAKLAKEASLAVAKTQIPHRRSFFKLDSGTSEQLSP